MTAAEQDLALWKTWNRTRASADLEALMHHVGPLIGRETSRFNKVVPPLVLDAKAKELALKAFETFDPNRAQLNTHLVHNLAKISRMAYERQSTLRVPEHQRLTYNRYTRVLVDLENDLGYKPSLALVADHLAIPIKNLKTVIANVEKRELLESGEGPSFAVPTDDSDLIELAYASMTPRQQQVFDYRTGSHGKPRLVNPQIVAKLGIPQWQLSAELTQITALLKRASNMARPE